MKTEAQKLCEALLLDKIKECERLREENEWLMGELETLLAKHKERLIKAKGETK